MESMVWNEEIEMKALLSLFALSLIATGLIGLLTLTLATGVMFSESLFGQAFRVEFARAIAHPLVAEWVKAAADETVIKAAYEY